MWSGIVSLHPSGINQTCKDKLNYIIRDETCICQRVDDMKQNVGNTHNTNQDGRKESANVLYLTVIVKAELCNVD